MVFHLGEEQRHHEEFELITSPLPQIEISHVNFFKFEKMLPV